MIVNCINKLVDLHLKRLHGGIHIGAMSLDVVKLAFILVKPPSSLNNEGAQEVFKRWLLLNYWLLKP